MVEQQTGQMNSNARYIDRMLVLSTVVTFICALLGMTFFFLTNSEAILLDGMFNIVSFFVALLSCKVSRMSRIPWTPAFHFGFGALEPLFVIVRGVFILAVGVAAMIANVQDLFSDEVRQVNVLPAFFYAIVCTILCLVVYILMRRGDKKVNSPILEAEGQNWFINGLISFAVGVAFLCAYLFRDYDFMQSLRPHLDSLLVIVVVLITLPMPLIIIKNGVLGVLGSAPEKSLQHKIREAINAVLPEVGMQKASVLQIKPGNVLSVLIFAVPTEQTRKEPLESADKRREMLEKVVLEVYEDSIVEVIFTMHESRLPGEHTIGD